MDDRGEVLDRERIGARALHVPQRQPQIGQGSAEVIDFQTADGPLQPEGAQIEKLAGGDGFVHGATIARAPKAGDLRLMS